MKIRKHYEDDFINETYSRVMNRGKKDTASLKTIRGGSYTHIGHRTWPDIIRLYKESKK